MSIYQNIGHIFEKEDEQLFEWTIPTSCLMKNHKLMVFKSPHFSLPDSTWYLTLHRNAFVFLSSEEWFPLCLNRADINGSPKSITYTLRMKVRKDSIHFTKTHNFSTVDNEAGDPRFVDKRVINSLFNDHINTIKITCEIHNCLITSQQETPNSLSCAVDTEVPDSVIDKENSRDEDWSSLDIKEFTILRDRMKELCIKGNDHDLTICVQNKEFRAHRNILSARSPVFAMMLTHDTKENNTGTINIEDCDPDTFGDFLLYLYSGKTENFTPGKAIHLYYTADKYDFPVLKERCASLLKTSLSITSICDVVLLAARHHEKELLEVASEFFAINMEAILVTVGWQTFMAQNSVEANELLIKSTKLLHPIKCGQKKHFP